MESTTPRDATARRLPVDVITDDGEAIRQPKSFQFCPLGLQFYSRRQLAECSLLEFRLKLPDDNGGSDEITCSGLVVNCQHDPRQQDSLYRVWVKFLDLPESARGRIHCVTKSTDFLCPFCENF